MTFNSEGLMEYLLSDTDKTIGDIKSAIRMFNIQYMGTPAVTLTIYGNDVWRVSVPNEELPLYFAARRDGTCRRCIMTKQGLNYVGQGGG